MVGNRSAIEANTPWGNTLRQFIEYAAERGGIYDWESGKWVNDISGGQSGGPRMGASGKKNELVYSWVRDIVRLAPRLMANSPGPRA